jgi:hypothetical protein
MSKLNAARRNALPNSAFALQGERAYPVYDHAHAANAKARASQAFHDGRISKSTENRIDAAADRELHGS